MEFLVLTFDLRVKRKKMFRCFLGKRERVSGRDEVDEVRDKPDKQEIMEGGEKRGKFNTKP